MNEAARIRILLAEPFELTRRGLHEILAADPGHDVIADLSDVRDAPGVFERNHPDVCLIGMESKEQLSERRAALDAVATIISIDEWAPIGVITDVSSN